METLLIIKVGGNVLDDPEVSTLFLKEFSGIKGYKILVHGGGKEATSLAKDLHIEQQIIEGRRITNADTLKVVTMVYAGLINKNIVATLQSFGCNAVGLTGADANVIRSHKRVHPTIDYGFVGDVDEINSSFLELLLVNDLIPVLAPVTHDKNGTLLNTNADTIAREVAIGLSHLFEVTLIYCFEKRGVLKNIQDEASLIKQMNRELYEQMKDSGSISEGMIPKLDNSFAAIAAGIKKVIIGKATLLQLLISEDEGTTISG